MFYCKISWCLEAVRLVVKLLHRFEIWQVHRQQGCRCASQISERSDNSKYKSHGFETLQNLTMKTSYRILKQGSAFAKHVWHLIYFYIKPENFRLPIFICVRCQTHPVNIERLHSTDPIYKQWHAYPSHQPINMFLWGYMRNVEP